MKEQFKSLPIEALSIATEIIKIVKGLEETSEKCFTRVERYVSPGPIRVPGTLINVIDEIEEPIKININYNLEKISDDIIEEAIKIVNNVMNYRRCHHPIQDIVNRDDEKNK